MPITFQLHFVSQNMFINGKLKNDFLDIFIQVSHSWVNLILKRYINHVVIGVHLKSIHNI